MWLPFMSAEEIAKGIRKSWSVAHGATARPFNRFEADDSRIWWIVPSNEVPTFKFTKVIISTSDDWEDGQRTFIGLHCEKGLGPAAGQLDYYPDHLLIDDSWSWNTLTRDLAKGTLQNAISIAAGRLAHAVTLRADAHVPVIPKRHPGPPRDRVIFHTTDGHSLAASRAPELGTEQGFLGPAVRASTVPELSQALARIPSADFAWIDFCIGASFRRSPDPDERAWTLDEIGRALLGPLQQWFQ